jgi:hypothetical protein
MVLIFVSYDGINAETKLRNTPEKLNKKDIKPLAKKCNFFDRELNANGDFTNDFVDNGDGTITDRATGLMWEKEGSSKEKTYYFATKYVKKLNKKEFAGHNDWRIPTIEELYSLLEPNENKKRYINPAFSSKPSLCWSIDDSDIQCPHTGQNKKLVINYEEGTVTGVLTGHEILSASTDRLWHSSIRAVRSIQ